MLDIGAAKHCGPTAVGLQVDSGTVSFTGTTIKVQAKNTGYSARADELPAEKTKLSDGADAKAYGIRVNDGEVTAKLTDNLVVENVVGGGGTAIGYGIIDNTGVESSKGGNAIAYGAEVNGGIAHFDLQDIIIDSPGGSYSNYISGGFGSSSASQVKDSAGTIIKNSSAGKGGDAIIAGIHVTGGKVDGNIKDITIEVDSERSNGGSGNGGTNCFGSNGGAGGDAYAAGISNDGGAAKLTVASMDIKASGGTGGTLGSVKITDASLITATGKVQAAAGKGGEVLTVGVDNLSGSSNVTVTGNIKLTATGGDGGAVYQFGFENPTPDSVAPILATERVSGEGGAATAVGLQNVDGTLTAEVAKLEIKAVGGQGGAGGSTYNTINGFSAEGGAAAAYGINVLGGLAESLTVAEITVEATGGTSKVPTSANAGANYNDDGSRVKGSQGGKGGIGAAYGVSNSGGSAVATVGTITAKATGGKGGDGGIVEKKIRCNSSWYWRRWR